MKEYGWTPEYIGATKTRMQVLLWLGQVIEWKEREAGIKRPSRKKVESGQEMQHFLGGPNMNRGHAGRGVATDDQIAQRDTMWASVFDSIGQPSPAAPQGSHTIDDAIEAIAQRTLPGIIGPGSEEWQAANEQIRAQAEGEALIQKALREAGG